MFNFFGGNDDVRQNVLALSTIIGVLLTFAGIENIFSPYTTWSSVAGVTIWFKVFADYIVSRQAHPFELGRKKIDKKKETEEEI